MIAPRALADRIVPACGITACSSSSVIAAPSRASPQGSPPSRLTDRHFDAFLRALNGLRLPTVSRLCGPGARQHSSRGCHHPVAYGQAGGTMKALGGTAGRWCQLVLPLTASSGCQGGP